MRKCVIFLLSFLLLGTSVQAQSSQSNSEATEEEQELIELLEFLEVMDILEEEELDFIEDDDQIMNDLNSGEDKE